MLFFIQMNREKDAGYSPDGFPAPGTQTPNGMCCNLCNAGGHRCYVYDRYDPESARRKYFLGSRRGINEVVVGGCAYLNQSQRQKRS